MRLAGAKEALVILMKLSAVCPMEGRTDIATALEAYAEDLERMPGDLIDQACREWRRSNTFFPSIANLLKLIEPAFARLKRRRFLLGVLQDVADHPAPEVTWNWVGERFAAAHRSMEQG